MNSLLPPSGMHLVRHKVLIVGKKMIKHMLVIFLGLILFPRAALSEEKLKLQIIELPPYIIVKSATEVGGTVVEPTLKALHSAGIDFEWEVIPANRQIAQIKNNQEKICSVGWYKTPERELFAKYSKPILIDSKFIAFANIDFNSVQGETLDDILSDPKTQVLIKSSLASGNFLDEKFKNMKATAVITSAEIASVFKMIQAGRAHITFVPADMLKYYQDVGIIQGKNYKVLTFDEMPAGRERYLMCSKLVDDQTIKKFNKALN
ncbi:hypothetical protein ACO0K2_11690 [Undibacterium sp. MH2W]|uniref:hypothetical protein n=1 Tax=Undibacterium sp. MH2W TaxID=3413044 RepID=UPI003BF0A9D8